MEPGTIERTEQWFISHGIPHFINDYSASRDVLTRALPLLSLIFLLEVLGALNLEWPVWLNAAAFLGGIAILIAGLLVMNAIRGRSPWQRPEDVGSAEVALFVLGPALLPLVFGGQAVSALTTAVGNLVLLAGIYLGTSYGIVAMLRWALIRMVRQLGDILDLVVRTLPMLLLFVTFLFINAEVWQVASGLEGPFLATVLALFAALGALFVLFRLPREIGRLASFESPAEVVTLVSGTPVEAAAHEVTPSEPRLSQRQWINAGLVVLFSQGIQILLVSVLIALFFVGFGLLTVGQSVIESWTGGSPDGLFDFELWGRPLVMTSQLLRVAGFLGAFSGLYFTVYAITDATYRAEFYEEVVQEVRQAFAVRAVYSELVNRRSRIAHDQ